MAGSEHSPCNCDLRVGLGGQIRAGKIKTIWTDRRRARDYERRVYYRSSPWVVISVRWDEWEWGVICGCFINFAARGESWDVTYLKSYTYLLWYFDDISARFAATILFNRKNLCTNKQNQILLFCSAQSRIELWFTPVQPVDGGISGIWILDKEISKRTFKCCKSGSPFDMFRETVP